MRSPVSTSCKDCRVTKHSRASSAADASGCSARARNTAYWAIERPVGFSAASHRRRNPCWTRVVNYAQWRSAEAFQAMLQNGTARQHMAQCAELANGYDPHLYIAESVHTTTN
jgi:hypothetical protein